jgi:hypothetical protein
MIYITGDTHGLIENFNRKGISKIKKRDVLIITGDFGFVWDNSESENRARQRIERYRFPVLFVEGCHDNYDLLKKFPLVEKFGGYVRQIGKNIFQLLRGHVYDIDGQKVFAFGGGECDEKEIYKETGLWWKDEEPTEEEAVLAVENLKACGSTVDIVVTHDASTKMRDLLVGGDPSLTNMVLEYVSEHTRFKAWYFGKYHFDRKLPANFYAVASRVHKADFDVPVIKKKK